jgi:hypothetical protein
MIGERTIYEWTHESRAAVWLAKCVQPALGEEVARLSGTIPAGQLIAWLRQHIA